MATENTEGSSNGGGASLQEQFLSALQLTQKVTQQFVSAWFDGAVDLVTQMANVAKVPAIDALPEPATLFELAQKMVSAQQSFIQDAVSQSDPISFLSSLKVAQSALLQKPSEVAAANARLALGLDAAVRATVQCATGATPSGPLSPAAGDQRFADPRLQRESTLFPARAAVPPRMPVRDRTDRRRRAGRDRGRQGAFRRHLPPRRARADQFTARKSRRTARGLRLRRREFDTRRPEHDGRHREQRWLAVPGRLERLRGRSEHGRHNRWRRIGRRAHRADPVRAADRAGVRGATAVLSSVDQQVLHHGPRAR